MTGDKVEKDSMTYSRLSDLEMANKVRMLMRDDLSHEFVCVGARDRIMYLSQQNSALSDHIDLMVDEFKRIQALCHDTYLHNTEISGLCERAVSNTVQHVPVILQRDQSERRAERLQRALEQIVKHLKLPCDQRDDGILEQIANEAVVIESV